MPHRDDVRPIRLQSADQHHRDERVEGLLEQPAIRHREVFDLQRPDALGTYPFGHVPSLAGGLGSLYDGLRGRRFPATKA